MSKLSFEAGTLSGSAAGESNLPERDIWPIRMPAFRSDPSWSVIVAGAALSEWRVNRPERPNHPAVSRIPSSFGGEKGIFRQQSVHGQSALGHAAAPRSCIGKDLAVAAGVQKPACVDGRDVWTNVLPTLRSTVLLQAALQPRRDRDLIRAVFLVRGCCRRLSCAACGTSRKSPAS